MYCVHCGTFIPEPSRTCGKCGQPLAVPAGLAGQTPAPSGEQIPSHMIYAFFATFILGIPPIGAAAIIFAGQVNAKLAAGDLTGARRASEMAHRLSAISMGTAGVILIAISLVLIIH